MVLIRSLLLCGVALSLSGCFALGLLTGAGGAYVATDKIRKEERAKARGELEEDTGRSPLPSLAPRSPEPLPQPAAVKDEERILSEISRRFIGGELTKVIVIHPAVQDGVVTLNGTVPSQGVADRAVAITNSVPGVRKVVSRLEVHEVRIAPPEGTPTP